VLIKKSVIVLIALLLSACGYHFRGAFELPAGMKNIFLDGGSAPLQSEFNKAMSLSAIPIAASAETAGIVIRIFDEISQRRVLSLAATGVANDFELGYQMEYEIVDAKDNILMARQLIEIKREYYNDQLATIAKSNEESIIINEMYLQAVRTIVNRAKSVIDAKPK
jgi:LPS-assembly lipoprotein